MACISSQVPSFPLLGVWFVSTSRILKTTSTWLAATAACIIFRGKEIMTEVGCLMSEKAKGTIDTVVSPMAARANGSIILGNVLLYLWEGTRDLNSLKLIAFTVSQRFCAYWRRSCLAVSSLIGPRRKTKLFTAALKCWISGCLSTYLLLRGSSPWRTFQQMISVLNRRIQNSSLPLLRAVSLTLPSAVQIHATMELLKVPVHIRMCFKKERSCSFTYGKRGGDPQGWSLWSQEARRRYSRKYPQANPEVASWAATVVEVAGGLGCCGGGRMGNGKSRLYRPTFTTSL